MYYWPSQTERADTQLALTMAETTALSSAQECARAVRLQCNKTTRRVSAQHIVALTHSHTLTTFTMLNSVTKRRDVDVKCTDAMRLIRIADASDASCTNRSTPRIALKSRKYCNAD